MSRRIVVEALVVVVTLRAEELAGHLPGRRARPIAGVPELPSGPAAADRAGSDIPRPSVIETPATGEGR